MISRLLLLLMVASGCGAAPVVDADAGVTPVDAGAFDAGSQTSVDAGLPTVRVEGRKLLVNGVPFEVRSVAWNPIKKGQTHPGGIDFVGTVERDAQMMHDAGFNAVRTYITITDLSVLDALQRHGIWVLNNVYSYGGEASSVAVDRVRAVANHPAMLAWTVGNEWNYNGLYTGLSAKDSRDRLNEVMALIRQNDTRLPIVNVYGELPPADVIAAMPLTDIWAINSYRGLSFGDLFTKFAPLTTKPMMLGEYGADAWNALIPAEDQGSQAKATQALTHEIHVNWSGSGTGVAIGGSIFEWCDEWWKDGNGSADKHDVGGVAPGGGPYPDSTFNEEWWGLVDIDRNPRSALAAAKAGWGL